MSEIEISQSSQKAGGRAVKVLSLTGQLDANTFLKLQKVLETIGPYRAGEDRILEAGLREAAKLVKPPEPARVF